MITTIIFSLFACVPEIKSVEEERFIENPAFDYDQDGYTENQGDCDDRNPDVYPNGSETCDGFDNDCNGVVDDNPEDIQTYYRDEDGDGFGSETESELACPADKSDGYIEEKLLGVEVKFDCDDTDPLIHPVAEEVCDFIDNDCDQYVDEDVSNAPLWYFDGDGDGYGNFDTSEPGCANEDGNGPDGYVGNYADCNDSNSDVFPNADEYCNEIDDNCNGIIDEALSVDAQNWYADSDSDGFGLLSNAQPSCSQPEGFVSLENVGDCNDDDQLIHPAALESCEAEGDVRVDEDCDGLINEGADTTAPVGSPTFYADIDGDGFGDLNATLIQCDITTGYVSNSDDCDDGDAALNPNTTWYLDSDGDGDGDASQTLIQCTMPFAHVDNTDDCNDGDATLNADDADADGFSSCNGDCDDSSASTYPNADEYCNSIDDNCDGSIDEGVDSTAPTGSTVWYLDSDGDGDGDALETLTQCTMPSTHVDNTDDCDDGDATLNADDADSDGFSTCDDDCDDSDASANLSDADGDGMDSCSGDCDDNDSSIYLNATESCNSIDDDCDGSIDEEDAIDRLTWYADSDGDGEGNGGAIAYACDQPSGYVANLDDCVDSDATIHTLATEICDAVDNNCDGQIDDNDANVDLNTATEFFQDADFDGYGNPLQSTYSCLQSPGFVTNSDDCDDANLLRNPVGNEYCNNIDDNCNGVVDELASDGNDYFIDADGDGHGALVDSVTGFDLNSCPTFDAITNQAINPTGYAPSNDDCDDTDAAISPSANERCSNGVDENCDGHNTAGATNVSTFLADADGDGFGSGEQTFSGALAYALDSCLRPYGYVPYNVNAPLDCDDGDSDVKPGATELCNGQRDDCPADGDNSVPANELDDDEDGFVECELDSSTYVVVDAFDDDFGIEREVITVNNWSDSSLNILGGGDCDDNDVAAFPGAVELCNGAFENCWDPLLTVQDGPELEMDDDGDCFVECSGFDSNTWEGGVHSCEHVDDTGQMVQETVVIGGEDCIDNDPAVYVGAAINSPQKCTRDADGDGYEDCNLVGLAGTNDYFCDFAVFPPNGGMGPDFVLIEGGLEPLGRYTLTNDFYVMTTEVTQAMWTDVMATSGYGYSPSWNVTLGQGDLYPAYEVSWNDAIAFANALSVMTGRAECYANNDLDPLFSTPYDCTGFRLLTEAEWEYAARSGTTSGFWTGQGSTLGGPPSHNYNTNGTETIVDGVSNPLLRDYAWYGGNNNNQYGDLGSKEVGQKLPNGVGLYDVHGNLWEWTADWWGCSFPPTSTDPYCDSIFRRMARGGGWFSSPGDLLTSNRSYYLPGNSNPNLGFRLGILP